jgi:hypothetical protein
MISSATISSEMNGEEKSQIQRMKTSNTGAAVRRA